jgi:hypothetical protein
MEFYFRAWKYFLNRWSSIVGNENYKKIIGILLSRSGVLLSGTGVLLSGIFNII